MLLKIVEGLHSGLIATVSCGCAEPGCEHPSAITHYLPTKPDCHALAKYMLPAFGAESYETEDSARPER